MKIALTGHTSGIGKALYDILAHILRQIVLGI